MQHTCADRGGGAGPGALHPRGDHHPPFFSLSRVSTAPLFRLTPPKGVHACDDLSMGIRIKEIEGEIDRQTEIKHIHIIQYLTVLSIRSVWRRLLNVHLSITDICD